MLKLYHKKMDMIVYKLQEIKTHITRNRLLRFFEKNQNTNLPYLIEIDSGKPGKNILLVGATHGNEPVGVQFNRFLYKQLKSNKIKFKNGGKLYLLLGNPKAFSLLKRFVDVNLNRTYPPKKEDSSYEAQRAKEIINFFDKIKLDYVIDIHSVSVGNTKMYVLEKTEKELLDTIKSFTHIPTIFSFDANSLTGIFTKLTAKKWDAQSFAIECGNHFSPSALNTAKKEILTFLSKINFLEVPEKYLLKKPIKNLNIYQTISKIKTGPNFKWLVKAKSYLPLEKGQAFAKDDKNGVQKAPKNCLIMMPSKKPDEKDHDAGFLVEKIN